MHVNVFHKYLYNFSFVSYVIHFQEQYFIKEAFYTMKKIRNAFKIAYL